MPNLPALPACVTLSRTGLSLQKDIALNDWIEIGKTLKHVEQSLLWWIGDWLNYGEKKYGEAYAQALDATEYEYQTLANAAYVSKQIEFSRRRENLSFSHHAEVAALEPAEQNKWLDKAEQGLSRNDLRSAIRDHKRIAPAPAKGKYAIIYADPPWQYADKSIASCRGGAEKHYPTMSIAELCAMPVSGISEDNAVLFLWVTSPILEEAFQVINAWNFQYRASFVWDKVKHNMGHYNSVRHEFLLLCIRGSYPPDSKKLIDSVQSIERSAQHSEKPEEFRKIIDTLYTHGKRIELFARGVKPKGWDTYGNEVG